MKRNTDLALLLLRLMLAGTLLFHGIPKILHVAPTVGFMQNIEAPVPALTTVFVIVAEVGGGLLLLLGLWVVPAGLLVVVDMIGAILLVHLRNGFNFLNNGIEFPLTVLVVSLALVLAGPGRYALGSRRADAAG
ncbi:MAG: DoxX family protein [Gemmatimonadales bacterium]